MSHCIVYTTCSNEAEAKAIAENLVETELVACANIIPGLKSIYKWEKKLCEDSEALLVLKTTKKNFSAIEKNIQELHSYDCPCIISVDIDHGSEHFLKFINAQCSN